MKCLVFLLVCLSAAAAIRLGYLQNKRYTYEYETILAHGIPEAFHQDVAIRLFAKAHLDYLADDFVILRLEDVVLQTMKGKLLEADRIKKVVAQNVELTQLKEHIKVWLELPVKFKFKGRKLEEEIIASKKEPKWCLNIKRALINHVYLPIRDNAELFQTRTDEVTVAGKCKTSYTIVNKAPYYKVKRVIDFHQCTERPDVLEHNVPNVDKFFIRRPGRGTAKMFPTFVRSAAYIHYDLQKTERDNFLIEQVVSESEHDFTMFGDGYRAGKAVGARTQQILRLLKKEQPIPKDANAIEDERKRGGLMFVYDDGTDITFTAEAQKNILPKVKTHIDTLRDNLAAAGGLNVEVAQTFTRLVSVLRRCTTKSLVVVAQSCLNEKNTEVKEILFDALARVGTVDAIDLLKQYIKEGKIEQCYHARILSGLGWIRKLNAQIIYRTMEICTLENVAAKQEAQRMCWLSLGNLVNRLMWLIRTQPRLSQNNKVQTLMNVLEKTFIQGITENKDMEVKITFIKAIGNAGFITDTLLKTVVTYVKNRDMPLHVRVNAVWALRHMARVRPVLVRQCLLPIFANPIVDAELRIGCYKILINNDPSLHTCQFIASVIAREIAVSGPRSNQVVSFIASDIRASMVLDPYNFVMASRARVIIRFIPRNAVFGLFAYSKTYKIAVGAERPALGIHINKVNGRETFIPRHLGIKTKLHLPGLSADFVEFGARIQGVHDMLQSLIGPKNARPKRSLDILSYIFGHVTTAEGEEKQAKFQAKLAPRFSAYAKLFGSEFYYGKLVKEDLVKFFKNALFNEVTEHPAGFTFSKTGIAYKQPINRAHLLAEVRYYIPTLTGIPLKISSKTAAVFKGLINVDITATPKLITWHFDKMEADVQVMPKAAIHMHNKVGAWLPVFETSIIVKNHILTAPKVHLKFTMTNNLQTTIAEIPIADADQRILEMTSKAHAIMRKELTPGLRQWTRIDLGMKMRGMVKMPKTCYGGKRFGLAMCVERTSFDRDYVRTKRLPVFPYCLLDNMKLLLTNGEDAPKKIVTTFTIKKNDDASFHSYGMTDISGKTIRKCEYTTKCDIAKMACDNYWVLYNRWCQGGCQALTKVGIAKTEAITKILVEHQQYQYRFDTQIGIEKEGRLMRIVNTWNKLPERIHLLVKNYYPHIIIWLHRYFAIDVAKHMTNRCEVRVHLHNKFTADVFVDTPTLRLRRINQLLPIALKKFPTSMIEIKEMINSRYGTCHVKGNNYIKTTDNVVITERIPGTCPVVLAKDTRDVKNPAWQILLKLDGQGQQSLTVILKDQIFAFTPDLKVMKNGQVVKVDTKKEWGPVTVIRKTGKLVIKTQFRFECDFDGTQTIVLFMPWWHNRIHGACGNNDGEQWTDMITRRNIIVPETLPREFIREWVVEGKKCKDPVCKLQAKHIKLAEAVPAGHKCFTNGRFLRCMTNCQPLKQQTVTVAHHCFPENSALIARIEQGDKTVDLANMSVDVKAPIVEHLACKCTCT